MMLCHLICLHILKNFAFLPFPYLVLRSPFGFICQLVPLYYKTDADRHVHSLHYARV